MDTCNAGWNSPPKPTSIKETFLQSSPPISKPGVFLAGNRGETTFSSSLWLFLGKNPNIHTFSEIMSLLCLRIRYVYLATEAPL